VASPSVFQRARTPEQKNLRRAAILDAAAQLGRTKGVRAVSLGDIAAQVGLTKSNVLRYFETREDIYLQLTAAGYREWAERAAARLEPLTVAGAAEIAAALVDGLAADALFCDLICEGPAALEHNVSPEAVLAFKRTLFAAVDDLADTVVARAAGLDRDQAIQAITATVMLASGLWPWSNPPPVLAELYRTAPDVVGVKPDFESQLRRSVHALILGLAAPGAP
jgi:AcrR family transcriptional regulator